MTPIDLNGQIAAVTGGGRGIGRVIAQTLAAAGATVAVLTLVPIELGVYPPPLVHLIRAPAAQLAGR